MIILHVYVCVLYLAVNNLITDKIENIFYLIAEHSGWIKYSLNKLYEII